MGRWWRRRREPCDDPNEFTEHLERAVPAVQDVVQIHLRPTPPAGFSVTVHAYPPESEPAGVDDPAMPRAYADYAPTADPAPRTWTEALPPQAAHLADRLDTLQALVDANVDHGAWWSDGGDHAALWASEEARVEFVDGLHAVESELRAVLPDAYVLEVSYEPGVTEIRLMGEYGTDWPLWSSEGHTEPKDFPAVSDALVERLEAWGRRAQPDSQDPNDPEVTRELAEDLRRALGLTFVVEVTDP